MLAGFDGRKSIVIATDGHDTDDELRALTAELRFQQLLRLLSSPLSLGP